jgi:hypothetical protein
MKRQDKQIKNAGWPNVKNPALRGREGLLHGPVVLDWKWNTV